MAEFIYTPVQKLQPGTFAVLNTAIPCNKGYVVHKDETDAVVLRGVVNNRCGRFARYRVSFYANIAASEESTTGEIQLALSVNGDIVSTSIAMITPAVANTYWNVTGFATIDVPAGESYEVDVMNNSPFNRIVNVRNLNVEVLRKA